MGIPGRTKILILFIFLSASYGCRHVPVPKPRGHFRIDLPERQYVQFNEQTRKNLNIPLTFEYPAYGHLTYQDVKNDLDSLLEQSYDLNVKYHVAKADAIKELVLSNRENKVYGILYDLKGNTASAVEFYVTDSLSHYLRGSLYFATEPNADSLAPVIDFFREDIIHLIETLKWRK